MAVVPLSLSNDTEALHRGWSLTNGGIHLRTIEAG
jgi:hypothetical protein